MAHWQIETKKLLVEFLPFENKGFIQVSLYDKDRSMFANLTKTEVIYITCNDENVKKLQSYRSISALVKYARANQIQQQAVTSCPAPALTPAKSSEQERGIFLRTSNTGIGKNDEIVEIAVFDESEQMLFHTLIKPTKHIPYAATAMHGINDYMVANSPSFADIWSDLSSIIGTKTIVFYNAELDKRLLLQSVAKAFDSPIPKHFYTLFPKNKTFCLMQYYAKHFGDWSDHHQCNKWKGLNDACLQLGVELSPRYSRTQSDVIKLVRLYKRVKELRAVA